MKAVQVALTARPDEALVSDCGRLAAIPVRRASPCAVIYLGITFAFCALVNSECVENPAALMATMVMDHIAAKGRIAPKLEGRIKGE